MNLDGMSKKQLLDLVIELAGSLKEDDLYDPETYSLVNQLLDLLDDSGDSIPQDLINKLQEIKDPKEVFMQAVQLLGITNPGDLARVAHSLKGAGLLNKSENIEELIKATPIDLTNSHILMYPVHINGKHHDEDPSIPPYHVTLKWMGVNKPVEHDKVSELVNKHKLHPPKITKLEPKTWASPRGDIHVLALHGDHDNLHAAHGELSEGNKSLHPYVPHITVSKELHDRVKNEGLTPDQLGIHIGPLEYHVGDQKIKEFHPAPEADAGFVKPLAKWEDLDKSVNGDWKEDKKYRFKHHEYPGGKGQSIRVFHGAKRVGHLAFSSHSRKDGYHEAFNANIDSEHRGKGLYQEMIRQASEKSVEGGGSGLKSEGYQRSPDATRVWDKVATHAEPFTNNHQIKAKHGRPETSAKDTDYFVTPDLKKTISKIKSIIKKHHVN